jgi:hypothetical protein
MRTVVVLPFLLGAGVAFAGTKELRPIEPADLRQAIEQTTVKSLRKKDPDLTDKEFARKLKGALRSPMHLKQTFPGLLGTLLRSSVGTAALPGKLAPIGFDAHIENAGTVRIGKDARGHARSIETQIDVDDSGIGPAGVDAISIGTSLKQAGFGKAVMKQAYAEFGRAATEGDGGPVQVAGPKWGKIRRAWLAKNTRVDKRDGEQVLSFKKGDRARPKAYAAIVAAAGRNDVLSGYRILDVVDHDESTGGSGGLAEFSLLARDQGTGRVRVFRMKEQARPGVDELGVPQPSNAVRLRRIEQSLWRDSPEGIFFFLPKVALPGERKVDFLVRDELAIEGDLASGKDKDETAVKVARLYGREHAGEFGRLSSAELASWMKQSTKTVVRGFEELHKKLEREVRDSKK